MMLLLMQWYQHSININSEIKVIYVYPIDRLTVILNTLKSLLLKFILYVIHFLVTIYLFTETLIFH